MNIISARVEQEYLVDRKPCWEPCLYLLRQVESEFVYKANLWFEFSIRFNWQRARSFFRELNYVFMFKMPSPPLQSQMSWTMCLASSLSHSWENFKFFYLSFLRYFGLIMSCIWLCKDELRSKDDFFCVVTFILSQPYL